jgi:uncharacterized protein with NRDE domain
MCTVSLIPPVSGRGLRLVCNRDERRTRPAAWGPQLTSRRDLPVLAPVDSESLGTWIAVSGAGLVYALLNLTREGSLMPHVPRTSRGHVIPALAGAYDYRDATRQLRLLDLEQFAPYRLLITDGLEAAVCTWDGKRLEWTEEVVRGPALLSSSSLGDALVEAPRRALFEDLLAREIDPWRAQDRLHQHAWPDRRHLSVLMSRATAHTVSRTVVVLDDHAATMTYAPVIDGWMGPVTEVRMARLGLPLAAAG